MTDAELDAMERMWRDGTPVAGIAAALHYSPTTVYAAAGRDRARFPARNSFRARRARDGELVDAALGMFADGMTGAEVAAALGISESMAYRIRSGFV